MRNNADRDAREIGRLFERARRSIIESVMFQIECGKRLSTKKDAVGHGQWGAWLDRNREALGFGQRTARMLMRAAENRKLAADLTEAAALEISREIWGHNTDLPVEPIAISQRPYVGTEIVADYRPTYRPTVLLTDETRPFASSTASLAATSVASPSPASETLSGADLIAAGLAAPLRDFSDLIQSSDLPRAARMLVAHPTARANAEYIARRLMDFIAEIDRKRQQS